MDEICKSCMNEYPSVECINCGEKHYHFVAKDCCDDMNEAISKSLLVVYDNKIGKYRVVNLLNKTISHSSFDYKCDAESLMSDMIDMMVEDYWRD